MLRLIELNAELADAYTDYLAEWLNAGECIVPAGSDKGPISYRQFLQALDEEKTAAATRRGWVPATLFFLTDETDRLYGALQLRHKLNDALRDLGGHIGYGVRPSERHKGYATRMLALALDRARKLRLSRVLLTCDKHNIGSARTIMKNGGVLENEVQQATRITQRYWIEL